MAATSLSPLLSPTTQNQPKHDSKHPSRTGSFRLGKNMREVKQLHARITKWGLRNSHNIDITNIVSSCADIATPESLEYAKKACELYENDVTSAGSLYMLNCLIKGYSAAGSIDEAILTFAQIVAKGLTPDQYTFQFLMTGCSKEALFLEGIQLHGSVLKLGLGGDLCLQNVLIQFYADFGEIGLGKKVFEGMSERDVGSWTCLICGYARSEMPAEAVSLFFDMIEAGFKPNSVTMVCAISACAKLRDLDLGERVRAYIRETGVAVNTFMVNALIDMYTKCGVVDIAKQLFKESVDKNMEDVKQFHAQIAREGLKHTGHTAIAKFISSCAEIATPESLEYAKKVGELYEDDVSSSVSRYMLNTLIKGYTAAALADAAILVYAQNVAKGLAPDDCTFQFILNCCAKAAFYREGIQLHGSILKFGLGGDLFIQSCLVHFYAKCGQIDFGKKVFEEMSDRDVMDWTCLIFGCTQTDRPEEAVSLFFEMVEAGIKPDSVAMGAAILACAKLRDLDLGERVIAYMSETGLTTDTFVVNGLVDMYMKCGATDRARQAFNECVDKNLKAYTFLLSNYVHQGMETEALAIFVEMLQQGIQPDRLAIISVASAISELGDFAFGQQFHGYVLRNGFDEWESVDNAIIDMYANCGK